jgi:DNA-binding NtrC family response regulator
MAGSTKSSGTAEILVVDDDREVLQSAKGILIIAGYRVHVASQPWQAMQILDSDRKIDLLLTDEALPDMDGLDLAVSAVSLRRGLAILFMCARPEIGSSSTSVYPFVLKPFVPKQLVRHVRSALNVRPREALLEPPRRDPGTQLKSALQASRTRYLPNSEIWDLIKSLRDDLCAIDRAIAALDKFAEIQSATLSR